MSILTSRRARPRPSQGSAGPGGTARQGGLLAAGVLAPLVGWVVLVPVAGLRLTVSSGSGARTVGPLAVVVAALVGSGAALVLARLSRRAAHPRRTYLWLVAIGLVVSLTGPAQATTVRAALGLALLHVLVAAAVVPGSARALLTRRPAREAG